MHARMAPRLTYVIELQEAGTETYRSCSGVYARMAACRAKKRSGQRVSPPKASMICRWCSSFHSDCSVYRYVYVRCVCFHASIQFSFCPRVTYTSTHIRNARITYPRRNAHVVHRSRSSTTPASIFRGMCVTSRVCGRSRVGWQEARSASGWGRDTTRQTDIGTHTWMHTNIDVYTCMYPYQEPLAS